MSSDQQVPRSSTLFLSKMSIPSVITPTSCNKQNQELPGAGSSISKEMQLPPNTGVGKLFKPQAFQSITRGELQAVITFYFRIHSSNLLQQVQPSTQTTESHSRLLSCKSMAFPRQTIAKDIFSYTVTLILQRRRLLLQP